MRIELNLRGCKALLRIIADTRRHTQQITTKRDDLIFDGGRIEGGGVERSIGSRAVTLLSNVVIEVVVVLSSVANCPRLLSKVVRLVASAVSKCAGEAGRGSVSVVEIKIRHAAALQSVPRRSSCRGAPRSWSSAVSKSVRRVVQRFSSVFS